MRIFTLGTGHRPAFDFSRILTKYGVQVIFDVRRVPEAQEEHFRRNGLQALCAGQGVDYIYLGNELGGPQRDDYRRWTETDEFSRGLGIIRGKAPKRVCCILCAEESPTNCHRKLIGDLLAKDGFEIVHILDENRVWLPQPTDPQPSRLPRRPPRQPRHRPR